MKVVFRTPAETTPSRNNAVTLRGGGERRKKSYSDHHPPDSRHSLYPLNIACSKKPPLVKLAQPSKPQALSRALKLQLPGHTAAAPALGTGKTQQDEHLLQQFVFSVARKPSISVTEYNGGRTGPLNIIR